MTAPATPAKAGLFEDFIDIFTQPTSVFARRAASGGAAAFFIVWIALSLVTFSGRNVVAPIIEAQSARGMEQARKANPAITDDQVAAMKKVTGVITSVYAFVFPPLAILVLGLLTWAVGRILGAEVSAGTGIMIATYSYIPRIIGAVFIDLMGMFTDTSKLVNMSQLSLGPAFFMDPAGSAVMLALGLRLDVFVIWGTVLLGLGIAAAGKVPKAKGATGAVILWAVAGLFALWGASRQGG